MKVPILCDQCRREFIDEDWLMESTKEVLCPDCYSIKQEY